MPIARLEGLVQDKGEDWLIVGVGGIGLLVQAPAPAVEAVVVGRDVLLHTHLHVREDALTLYGFATPEELRLFEQLIGVGGVGPRVALGLLSALDHSRLAAAIVKGQADVLRRVPGVGQKTAERIVLDLRDKVSPPSDGAAAEPSPKPAQDTELIAALMGLGYTQTEASEVAGRLERDGDVPLEDRVRQALSFFGSPHR
jgi:Holliday junction DNA helicase RuvA